MHTVELLDQALEVARAAGYQIRQEWLGGSGGGGCEIGGQKWVFLDLALSPAEQLDQIVDTLRGDLSIGRLNLSPRLGKLFGLRKTA